MKKTEFDEDFNLELDRQLEERNILTVVGVAFLAVWILSMILLTSQN